MSAVVVNQLQLHVEPSNLIIHMLNGTVTRCKSRCAVEVMVHAHNLLLSCVVSESLVAGCDLLLGMDVILKLGGVTVTSNSISFGCDNSSTVAGVCVGRMGTREESVGVEGSTSRVVPGLPANPLVIEEDDFCATFAEGRWVVRWKWKGEEPILRNRCGEYGVSENSRQEYEAEVLRWIEDGWLEPYDRVRHGEIAGVIPLMAVDQPNKGNVRPCMDFRELNSCIRSYPGSDTAVCGEKLREWRKLGDAITLLDLKKAYLQLYVDADLQRFQTVRFQGQRYVMTRMGFGLNVAPKVMSRVLQAVLSSEPDVGEGTDSYIDDIVINERMVAPSRVRALLLNYGLVTKDPVHLDGARVLGLHVERDSVGCFVWTRDNALPELKEELLSKRELFSICGKLVGHYPVCSWLRVACSYMKRIACEGRWDEEVPSEVHGMLRETLRRVSTQDPAKGKWGVSDTERARVWCDASSIAEGVSLEVGGQVVEDASWLRKKTDGAHINVAELEAVVKGVNLALKWG